MRLQRLLTVAVMSVLLAVLGAAPAWAHAALIHTDPHQGSVLEYDPRQVVLTFSEPVGTSLGAVRVLGPDGKRVDAGTVSTRAKGTEVVVPIDGDLTEGTYAVVWRVVSEDSHPVSGVTTFSVGRPSTPAATAATAEQDDGGAAGQLLTVARGVLYAGLVLLVGGLAFVLVLWHAGRQSTAVRRLLWAGWGPAAAGSLAGLLLQGPYAAGLPLTSALDGALLGDVLGTRFGTASTARLLLLLPLAILLSALGRLPRRTAAVIAVPCVAGLLLSTSAVGHAAAGELTALALPLDALHLAAVSAWLGGLVVLLLAVLPSRDPARLAAVLPGWSRWAAGSVAVIVATGLFASWREVRELAALPSTRYGQLLLAKTALVLTMLVLGALGRRFVRRHYTQTVVHASTATSVAERPAPGAPEIGRLRTGVLLEAGTAAAVLALTAVLVETTPARVAYAPMFSQTAAVTGPLRVQVDLEPARTGINQLHVYYTGTGALAVDVEEVTARLVSETGETVPVQVPHDTLGHYEQLTVPLTEAGRWRLELTTRTSDIDATTTSFTVPVR